MAGVALLIRESFEVYCGGSSNLHAVAAIALPCLRGGLRWGRGDVWCGGLRCGEGGRACHWGSSKTRFEGGNASLQLLWPRNYLTPTCHLW